LNIFNPTRKAVFLERPNRFTLLCRLQDEIVKAYLPNPGRMWELLLPGAALRLEKSTGPDPKMPYTCVAVERGGRPVVVHTLRTNDLAQALLEKRLIPGLEEARIVKREARRNRSRFDFLLERRGREVFLEVKSCTLFGKRAAMFPDAVTARGRRHLEELAGLREEGRQGAVLFLIGSPAAEHFLPDYHTDLEFTEAFLAARGRTEIYPAGVEFNGDLSLRPRVRMLKIPWGLIRREAQDRGSYLIVLRLEEKAEVEVGKLGKVSFPEGYYLYVGSARRDLSRRIERHRRLRKTKFWHIDYLRERAEFRAAVPIRASDDLECKIAESLSGFAAWSVPGFGCSDCDCESHLFGMREDPLRSEEFISRLLYFRLDRLFP
jgi:sugar fermentation stimulation protein A